MGSTSRKEKKKRKEKKITFFPVRYHPRRIKKKILLFLQKIGDALCFPLKKVRKRKEKGPMIDDGGPSESVRMWKELKKGGRKETFPRNTNARKRWENQGSLNLLFWPHLFFPHICNRHIFPLLRVSSFSQYIFFPVLLTISASLMRQFSARRNSDRKKKAKH